MWRSTSYKEPSTRQTFDRMTLALSSRLLFSWIGQNGDLDRDRSVPGDEVDGSVRGAGKIFSNKPVINPDRVEESALGGTRTPNLLIRKYKRQVSGRLRTPRNQGVLHIESLLVSVVSAQVSEQVIRSFVEGRSRCV